MGTEVAESCFRKSSLAGAEGGVVHKFFTRLDVNLLAVELPLHLGRSGSGARSINYGLWLEMRALMRSRNSGVEDGRPGALGDALGGLERRLRD
jgi:hypothetical protein